MSAQLALLPELLTAHLQLTLSALLVGVLISVPAGIAVTRIRSLEQPVLGVASVIQTIPGLALLALMVPTLAALNLPAIGFLPAFLGLCLYSLLPILRNTVTGISQVDPAIIEAARGVGMTSRQRLRRVELPLAMPVIVAGLRTSTVWTVGMATLATPIGATSLGNYIFSGLATRNSYAVLVGCLASAALAILLDGLVRLLAEGLERSRRSWVAGSLVVAGGLYAYAVVAAATRLAAPSGPSVVVGAKSFTEQYILRAVLALQIERRTGLPTLARESLGSTVAFDGVRSGDIDLYVDYSGTIWATIMKRPTRGESRQAVLEQVRVFLKTEHEITIAAALGFENTYALAMRREQAARLDLDSISDLARHAPGLTMGGDLEFFQRAEWRSLQEAYGLEFRERRDMDPSLMYQAVAESAVDVISAFSTDGRIAAYDLIVLTDDRAAIPPYDAIVLAGGRLAREHPEVMAAVAALDGTISADKMRDLNHAVDELGRQPEQVAADFLKGLEAGSSP